MILSQIAKASLKSELLIDFDCYVDTEVGLIRLIKEKYLDENVFNVHKINQDIGSIILSLIDRTDVNPLYYFSNDSVDRSDLDDYYREFMTIEYDNVLKLSVITGIKSLINLLHSEPSIHVTFLCNDEREKQILQADKNLTECNIIMSNDKNIDYSRFNSYFFKYITDNVLNYIFDYKTYYFSKYKLNFNDEFNFIRGDIIDKIISKHGEIEILDLYIKSYLEGDN